MRTTAVEPKSLQEADRKAESRWEGEGGSADTETITLPDETTEDDEDTLD